MAGVNQVSSRFVSNDLGPVLPGEGREGRQVRLGVLQHLGDLGEGVPQSVDDMPSSTASSKLKVGYCHEGLPSAGTSEGGLAAGFFITSSSSKSILTNWLLGGEDNRFH